MATVTLGVLVDTGACRSMMRTSAWEAICLQKGCQPFLRPGVRLSSLTGHEIPTRGRASGAIYGHPIDFYISDDLGHDALFGTDALETLGAEIRYQDQTVVLKQIPHPCMLAGTQDSHLAAIQTEVDRWMREYPGLFSKNVSGRHYRAQ